MQFENITGDGSAAAFLISGMPGSPVQNIRFENITGLSDTQITDRVEAFRSETNKPKPGEWKPWFPVIDYDRCTNCRICEDHCPVNCITFQRVRFRDDAMQMIPLTPVTAGGKVPAKAGL